MTETHPSVSRRGAAGSVTSLRSKRLGLSDGVLWKLLLWPSIIVMFVVFIYPLLYSLYISLTAYNLIGPPRFIGLRNYINILSDSIVWNSVKVSLIFTIVSLVLELGIGFGVALILHDLEFGRSIFRPVTTMPLMLTPVVIGLVWRMMGNYDFGVFNYFTGLFGLPKIGWVVDTRTALPYLILSDVWHSTGFVVLSLTAGLAQLPEEVFEAAAIDGANFWQKLWGLTIPMLAPVFNVVLVFRLYNLIRMFDKAMTLTQGGPGRATETLSFHIYNRMFTGYSVGYSSAVSIFLMALTVGVCAYFIWKM